MLTLPWWQGWATSRRCGLTSDCIFSSAWWRESRERQTDRGGQSGRQRGTDRLSARQRHAQSPPPVPTQAPPAMHKAAQHEGSSYGGVGGGRAGGQGQHRSMNCNRIKPSVSARPQPAAPSGAAGAGHSRVQGTEVPVRGALCGARGVTGWDRGCSALLSSQHVAGDLPRHMECSKARGAPSTCTLLSG